MDQNPQFALASEYLHYTNKNVFLTGKAGTGKTTFLRSLKASMTKRMIIVAPTGIAAINAGGTTIHSFFQLPFAPFLPNNANQRNYAFSKEKVQIMQTLDVLVIDEISMVRADTLDNIDQILRQYRIGSQPFGGVQLLMIGDLFQLAPVVKEEEWQLLRPYYDNLFFFSSHALRQSSPITIELQHIYRQSDKQFIDILNQIRENQIDQHTLSVLNKRHLPVADEDGYITLTTHNTVAQAINEERLQALPSKSWHFQATITGDFPNANFPTDEQLELKVGAQVMFIKNDPSRDKLYYNGKIGTVISIGEDTIAVRCQGDYSAVEVSKATWFQIKFSINNETKLLEEQIIGQFEQYPLKLAWAITIHKSQGLTFDQVIIDANASFAHGQVYVALSRCRSLEGLYLRNPISASSIKMDATVSQFIRQAHQNGPDNKSLHAAKLAYEQLLIKELFDFSEIQLRLSKLLKEIQQNALHLDNATIATCISLVEQSSHPIFEVVKRFHNELARLMIQPIFLADNPQLQERLPKAIRYFSTQLDQLLYTPLQGLTIESTKSNIRHHITLLVDQALKSIFIKIQCLLQSQEEFTTANYLQIRHKAALDYQALEEQSEEVTSTKPDLYEALLDWRNQVAAEYNVLDYLVLPTKVIVEIVKKRPTSLTELAAIKGVGKTKAKKLGLSILEIIVSCTH